VEVDVQNVSVVFGFDYEYISDPPFLVDIGDYSVDMRQYSLHTNVTTVYHEDQDIYFNMNDLTIDL
jgi:hypothetical protein